MSKFEINLPYYHGKDSWHEYDGYDAEDAAREFAEGYDADDHPLMNSSDFVRVREVGSDEIIIVSISAEPSIDYHASEMTEYKCRQCKKDQIETLKAGESCYHHDDSFCSQDCYQIYYGVKK